MEIVAASDRHPDPGDGEPKRFSPWQQPRVQVGDLYGTAVAYTRSYGLIAWYAEDRSYRLEWFPATQIKRVDDKDWHGRYS
jgi:hypothetical protein